MEPVAGVGDVTCSLLLPVSVLLAKQKYCRFEFHFSRLFSDPSCINLWPAQPQRNLKIWCLMWNHVFVMSSNSGLPCVEVESERELDPEFVLKDARSVNRQTGCKLRWREVASGHSTANTERFIFPFRKRWKLNYKNCLTSWNQFAGAKKFLLPWKMSSKAIIELRGRVITNPSAKFGRRRGRWSRIDKLFIGNSSSLIERGVGDTFEVFSRSV